MRHEARFRTAPESTQFIDNGQLFMVAVNAAKAIAAPDREGSESNAWISMVFSVIALESFMNETVDFCESAAQSGERSATVSLFAQVMKVLESRKASLEDKLSVAHSLLTGKPANFGTNPYQDFSLLIALRNELVHCKVTPPLRYSEDYHPVREKLRNMLRLRKLLADTPEYAESWIFHVGTKAIAVWSCKTAANVLVDFIDKAAALARYVPAEREFYSHDFF
jgi:hypothetical protein